MAAGDEDISGPNVLNSHAYDLFHLGKPDACIELLRIAIELYPRAANLYDSLGEI